MTKVAGHEWLDANLDSTCCLPKQDGTACLMTRASLFQVTEADINTPDWAHSAHINRAEYDEVMAEKKRYDERAQRMMEALRSVCG